MRVLLENDTHQEGFLSTTTRTHAATVPAQFSLRLWITFTPADDVEKVGAVKLEL